MLTYQRTVLVLIVLGFVASEASPNDKSRVPTVDDLLPRVGGFPSEFETEILPASCVPIPPAPAATPDGAAAIGPWRFWRTRHARRFDFFQSLTTETNRNGPSVGDELREPEARPPAILQVGPTQIVRRLGIWRGRKQLLLHSPSERCLEGSPLSKDSRSS